MTSDLIDLGPTQRLRVVSSTPAELVLELFRTMGAGPSAVGKAAALWRFRREFRLGHPRGGA